MANSAIRGITIEIGGDTKKLGAALNDSEKKTQALQAELKRVETALKFNPDNVELLAQKQEILKGIIEGTSESLEVMENAQEQVNEQFENGEIGADQYRAFNREIITTRSKLDGLEEKLKTTNEALGDTGSETTETKTALEKLTDEIDDQETKLSELKDEYTNVVLEQGKSSEEAKALATEMESLNDELKGNKDRLSKAEKQADKLADALDDAGDSAADADGGFTIMKGALADLTSNAIQGAVSAIGDFLGSLLELSEATEEYRTMQSKIGGAAETFGYSFDFANNRYKDFYKYLGDDQAATNAITNLMGLGTSTKSVADLADGATAAWTAYGDSINVESLTEAISETIICGKVTGSFADTINWSADATGNLSDALSGNSKAQKAFNKAIKRGETAEDAFNIALSKVTDEQERADIVAKYLNNTYGESKEKYDEMNASVLDANAAELKLKDTQAKLGKAVEPVNTAITDLKSKALEAILPVVEKVADGFMNLYNWLRNNPTAMAIVTAIVIALAAAFGVLATALAIQGLIRGVTLAISLLNTTLLANPIVLIIALIAGLVAAFLYLWNNCDSFRQFFIDAWESIKNAAQPVIDALVEFFTVTIPQAWNSFTAWLPGFIDSIVSWFQGLPSKIWTWLTVAASHVASWGMSIWSSASSWVSNLVSTVVDWFRGLPGKIWTWLSTAIARVSVWGSQMWAKAKTTATNFVNSVVNFVKTLPTKIWTWLSSVIARVSIWGSNMASRARTVATNFVNNVINFIKSLPAKVWVWLTDVLSRVTTWGTNLVSKAKTAASNLVTTIVDGIKGLPEDVKSVGSDLVKGLWNGISDMAEWVYGKISGFGSGVLNKLKSFFGIESPSKVMRDEVGRYIAEGIGVGIEENADNPIGALKNLSKDMAAQDFDFNGATINRKLATTFTANPAQANSNAALLTKLDGIYDRLNRMQIVLDTGVLVGETIEKIDAGLATRQLLSARGV